MTAVADLETFNEESLQIPYASPNDSPTHSGTHPTPAFPTPTATPPQ